MKTKILLLTILITVSAFAVTMLDQPIQFNAIDLHSLTIDTVDKYVTMTFAPIAIDENGNILAVGEEQKPKKIPPSILIPASCMTVKELGLTDTNNFAEILFRTILVASGLDMSQSSFKWVTRIPVAETNVIESWQWDGTQSNLVTETSVTNYYKYE